MTPARRTVLAALALAPLTACSPTAPAVPRDPVVPRDPGPDRFSEAVSGLERRFDARIGVYAAEHPTGRTVAYRGDERFAFCSTFKALAAAAVLRDRPPAHRATLVRFTGADLMESSVITRERVATGMTVAELCDAALRHSDGTAGNLLLRDLGGPPALTAFARTLGDDVTRSDRGEPVLADAVPGDPRDTTSPRAIGDDLGRILLGDVLRPDDRSFLEDLLTRAETPPRIRAGVPPGVPVAAKTGTGAYGTQNDVGIVRPPTGAPLVVSVLSTRPRPGTTRDPRLVPAVVEHVMSALRP